MAIGNGLDFDVSARARGKGHDIIALPHGGPHAHENAKFDRWAQAYDPRGHAVLQPSVGGFTNLDPAFQRAGYDEWGGKMPTDLSEGLARFAETGIAEAGRACIQRGQLRRLCGASRWWKRRLPS